MGSLSKKTTDTEHVATDDETRSKLLSIVKDSRTVLLLSHGEDHKIVGRPMGLVKIEDDATIYLVTGIDSKKVDEMMREPRVTIAVQNGKGTAMVDGDARISQDRALIDKLWEDSWKPYFPEGKSDPTIALIIIDTREATFWEGGVAHGISYLWRHVKARLTGEEIEVKKTDQQKVDLRH
jgi:general stress protein 26